MKKTISIFFIASLVFLTACGGGDTTVTLPPAAPTTPPVTIGPEPEPTPSEPHTIFIYDPAGQTIGTSDGEFYYPLSTGKAANARDGFISIGDILNGINDTGTSLITQRLPAIPDKIAIAGSDIWIFENIYDAMSGKDYTKIWLNNSQYGAWTENQYTVAEAIITDSGDIVTIDTGDKYRNVQDQIMVVNYADHGGLLIHSVDATNHRANIKDIGGDFRVAFSTNYFFGAKEWVEADGVYYSWNGYTWDGTTLAEHATVMREFVTLWNSERPVLTAVGSRIEHSESVAYWIECNTGTLYRHTPSIDSLEVVILLYQGGGTRNSGQIAKPLLNPVLTADNLFFGWNGTIWKYNFNDALVSSFAAGVEIWRM